jgi:hypothetical protein
MERIMKRYDIRVRYSFEGTYTVAAEDRDEAKRMVNDDCGLVLGGDIHTTHIIQSDAFMGFQSLHNLCKKTGIILITVCFQVKRTPSTRIRSQSVLRIIHRRRIQES